MRLEKPRIAPLEEADWTPAQRAILGPLKDSGRLLNIFRTLGHHPVLFQRFAGFGAYILNRSTLPARDREILILRIGWLCRAPYEWTQHARIGLSVGLSAEELHRIAQGADAKGWSPRDRTLLNAVDEIYANAMLSNQTWNTLMKRYTLQQLIDLLMTVGEYNLVSMTLNSLGVQLEEGTTNVFPSDVAPSKLIRNPNPKRLTKPRVEPLREEDWTASQRALIEPLEADGQVLNIYRTLARHEQLFIPRLVLGRYIQRESNLPVRDREILILRTAWRAKSSYEFGHHTRIGKDVGLNDADIVRVTKGSESQGWTKGEAALVRAVDELYDNTMITDATWTTLSEMYNKQQLIDTVFTVAGYSMLATTLNSLGVPLEEGYPGFPE